VAGTWHDVESRAVTGAPGTPGGNPLEGDLVWIELPEQTQLLARGSLAGKVLAVFGPLPTSIAYHRKLVAAKPLAVIHVDERLPFSWAKNDGVFPLWAQRYGMPPTVTIPYLDAWKWRLRATARVRVQVDVDLVPATSWNAIADLPGSDPGAGTILLGAHHDTQANSVGADDNASGVVALLELARLLAPLPRRRSLRFVSFGTEEQLSVGSAAYVRAHREELNGLALMVNFDSFASPLGHHRMVRAGDKALEAFAKAALAARGLDVVASAEVVPFADHFCFSVFGVPALWFYRPNTAGGCRWQHHSAHDDLANISPAVAAQLLAAAGGLILEAANADSLPFGRGLARNQRRLTRDWARTLYGL
jgi:hypothetical protein